MRHKNTSWLNETRDQKNRCNDKCHFVMYFLDFNVPSNDRISFLRVFFFLFWLRNRIKYVQQRGKKK